MFCTWGVPMNIMAPMKNFPGGGCKVGQISSLNTKTVSVILYCRTHWFKTRFLLNVAGNQCNRLMACPYI